MLQHFIVFSAKVLPRVNLFVCLGGYLKKLPFLLVTLPKNASDVIFQILDVTLKVSRLHPERASSLAGRALVNVVRQNIPHALVVSFQALFQIQIPLLLYPQFVLHILIYDFSHFCVVSGPQARLKVSHKLYFSNQILVQVSVSSSDAVELSQFPINLLVNLLFVMLGCKDLFIKPFASVDKPEVSF